MPRRLLPVTQISRVEWVKRGEHSIQDLAAECDSAPAEVSVADKCRGSRTLFQACMVGCSLALAENDEFLCGGP